MTAVESFGLDVVRLSMWLILLVMLFAPLERLFELRHRASRRSIAADLGYFFLNGLLPAMLLAPPLAFVASLCAAITPAPYLSTVQGLPFGAKLVAGLIVSEIGIYWAHRWCHRSAWLWRFHAIHHSVEHLDWLANTRAHPLDVVFTRLCGLAPLYLLGLTDTHASGSAAMLPVYITLIGTVWSFLIHANVRWRFGGLEQIVATPAFHHWHHHNERDHRDTNFAALLPLLDRIFGTMHLPRRWPETYGIDRPVTGSLRGELLHPFLSDATLHETDRLLPHRRHGAAEA